MVTKGNELQQKEVICQVLQIVIDSIKSSIQNLLYHNNNDFYKINIELSI